MQEVEEELRSNAIAAGAEGHAADNRLAAGGGGRRLDLAKLLASLEPNSCCITRGTSTLLTSDRQ